MRCYRYYCCNLNRVLQVLVTWSLSKFEPLFWVVLWFAAQHIGPGLESSLVVNSSQVRVHTPILNTRLGQIKWEDDTKNNSWQPFSATDYKDFLLTPGDFVRPEFNYLLGVINGGQQPRLLMLSPDLLPSQRLLIRSFVWFLSSRRRNGFCLIPSRR